MDEYPKMLTKSNDKGGVEPVYYPPGHEKQGTVVIFENLDEERAYFTKKSAKKDDSNGHTRRQQLPENGDRNRRKRPAGAAGVPRR